MTAAPRPVVVARPVEQPFDLHAIDGAPQWRQGLVWPQAYPDAARLAEALHVATVAAIDRLPAGEVRDIGVLMGGYALASVLPLAEAACLVDAERQTGIRLQGQAPELAYLRGEAAEQPERRGGRSLKAHALPRRLMLRRWARSATWTGWLRLPLTMLLPQAVAVSHNPLLCQVARRSGLRIGFAHGEALFQAARTTRPHPAVSDAGHGAVEAITRAILDTLALSPDVRDRLVGLVEDQCGWFAQEAARDLAVLRDAPLPERLWAGTGGYWPIRAISVEVLRRGGEVTRFDHGGGAGLNRYRSNWALSDLSVSSRFYVATDALASRVTASGATELVAPTGGTAVSGGYGDPHIAAVPMRRAARRAGSRRSVLYGPGPLLGFRQLVPALLPDPVALDWQLRLVAQLKTLPIDLICRPHPEGLLRNRRHPVAALIEPAKEAFEALVARTDVFVFDYVQSTTFYLALCTNRPIVLIDMGAAPYAGDVANAIATRCRVVRADYGEDNLPRLDGAALEAAVCEGPAVADASFFRSLILGETGRA